MINKSQKITGYTPAGTNKLQDLRVKKKERESSFFIPLPRKKKEIYFKLMHFPILTKNTRKQKQKYEKRGYF